jgi:ABC-type amino acid transport substrate-binding protein
MRGALLSLLSLWVFSGTAWADLAEVQQKGVLRHFGVETANFVRDDGTGLDVELLTRFAESIGVRYERVPVSAADAQAFLQGRRPLPGFGPGDALSGGLAPSILPAGLAASRPLFPVQFWLLARGDSPIRGETSRGRIEWDIRAAKAKMKGRTVYAINDGLSTPFAEALRAEGFRVEYAGWRASDLVEKLRKNPDALAVLDGPSAMVALARWSGALKRLGVLSPEAGAVVLFRAEDLRLRQAFDQFAQGLWTNWDWARFSRAYYPPVFNYYTPFFRKGNAGSAPSWLKPDPAYYPKNP